MKTSMFIISLMQSLSLLSMNSNDLLFLLNNDNEKEIKDTVYIFQKNRIKLSSNIEEELVKSIIKKQNDLLKKKLVSLTEQINDHREEKFVLEHTKKNLSTSIKKMEDNIQALSKLSPSLPLLPDTQPLDPRTILDLQKNPHTHKKNKKCEYCNQNFKQKLSKPYMTPSEVQKAIFRSKRALMKHYKVQKERDLKIKMMEECEQQDSTLLSGKILDYSWCYYKNGNDLEIYPDGFSSSSSSTSTEIE